MSQSFKLFRLQQLDSQIDRGKARLQEIELGLSQDEALRLAQEQADLASQSLQTMQKALHRAEHEVQDVRLKIEQTESTLYSGKVRNPKELQDLQNEASALKRHRSTLEDRQLEVMIQVEEAEAAQQSAQTELAKIRLLHDKNMQALIAEKNTLEKDLARLENERLAAANAIPDNEIRLYNQLRQQRRGIAVAKVDGKACSACGSTLNSVLLQAARTPDQLARCETCGRILYVL